MPRTDIGDASNSGETKYVPSNNLNQNKHINELHGKRGFIILENVLTKEQLNCARNRTYEF